MKPLPKVRLQSVRSGVVGSVIFLSYVSAAAAQTIPAAAIPPTIDQGRLSRLTTDLGYPNSSQRFFEAGKEQFEVEIQQFLQEDGPPEPLLTVQPEVLKQFEDWFGCSSIIPWWLTNVREVSRLADSEKLMYYKISGVIFDWFLLPTATV